MTRLCGTTGPSLWRLGSGGLGSRCTVPGGGTGTASRSVTLRFGIAFDGTILGVVPADVTLSGVSVGATMGTLGTADGYTLRGKSTCASTVSNGCTTVAPLLAVIDFGTT
eukprot:2172821-Amphidinium_carterae.1